MLFKKSRSRKRAEVARGLAEADVDKVLYQFFLDTRLEKADDMSTLAGHLPPVSEMDHAQASKESMDRLRDIAYLIPMIHTFATEMARAMNQMTRASMDPSAQADVPEAFWYLQEISNAQIAEGATIGAISTLVDLGLIEVPDAFRKIP